MKYARATATLDALSLRVEATAAAYRLHLDRHQCQEQRWCDERNEIDFAADAATFAYSHARIAARRQQQMPAERVAEGIA